MKQFFEILYKALDTLKVLASFLSIVYSVFYFLQLLGVQLAHIFSGFLDPIANLTHGIIKHEFIIGGKEYDSAYVIAALMFVGIFFVLSKVNVFVAECIENAAFQENIRRAKRDAKENVKIARVFKERISKVDHFVIYLSVSLKYAINEALIGNKVDLSVQKNNNYVRIIENMSSRHNIRTEIIDGCLGIICEGFENFDVVFKAFLENLNIISSENTSCDLRTEISFIIDGMEGSLFTDSKRTYLKKILSFGYKNKAITTTMFAKRYEQERIQDFTLSTMGKIRFFDEMNITGSGGEHTDFELFTLKRRRA